MQESKEKKNWQQQKSNKKEPQTTKQKQSQNNKEDKKAPSPKKIHKGVFIADERRKGRGGRIKSTSIPNKIEVRMKRDLCYLHQTQVQWVEVGRYNRKEGKMQRKQEKKNMKFKEKVEDKGKRNNQGKDKEIEKYKDNGGFKVMKKPLFKEKSEEKTVENCEKKQEQKPQTKKQEEQIATEDKKQDQTVVGEEKEKEQQQKNQKSSQDQKDTKQQKRERQEESDSSQSEAEQNEGEKKQEKNENDDIIIIGQIKKQVSNKYWQRPFVGIIKFCRKSTPNNPQKQKYKQKSTKHQISIILDDHYLDLQPIHNRLPICCIFKDNEMQAMLEEYILKSMKINYNDKGGKIRNQIMDGLENTYALAKFAENRNGNIYVSVIKIIGKAKTIDGECNCFLYEHQLNDFQHTRTEEESQPIQLNITPIHKQFNDMVFTIDPLTSTDLDDALSVKKLQENIYEFGIHISDVSSYIQKIPREQIVRRTTSVYLPHYVYHMLPSQLVTICSENPNVPRLAFTIFVKMTQDGDILGSRIQKNVIKSRFKLAYEQAEGILRGELLYEKFNAIHQCTQDEYTTLEEKLKILQKIGLAHRKKRIVYQIFDNEEIKFELDEEKWPISYSVNSRITSQKLVEQFMIIGNVQAAKKLVQSDPKNSLIIHHPKPTDLSIRQFNDYFKVLNYKVKFENARQLQQDLLNISKMENVSAEIKKLCFFKVRRSQQTANYKRFSEVQGISQIVHFALDQRFYTHFTSPMRRFGDILVHQALNSLVDPKCQQKQLTDNEIQQANWGRRNTKRLKKDITEIYFCLMIYKTNKLVQTEAIVSSFGCKSISIFIPMLEMNKEIMWSEMNVRKAVKNSKDAEKVDVIIYLDKYSAAADIIWTIEKFTKLKIKIGCTQQIPLRLNFDFQVTTNKGPRKILPKQYN